MLVVIGCNANNNNNENENGQDNGQTPPPQNNEQVQLAINTLTAQWTDSSHSNILLSATQRDNCVVCHDCGAFANNQTELAALERDFHVSIDCRACHTGQGVELMDAGTVDIPTAQ